MNSYNKLKEQLLDYAYKNEIPLVGEFELTGNCNFNCEMCYAKSNETDLTKEEWINIFHQAQSAGMLYALLTGGEIFLRPDFIYLYESLYDEGVKITLYTNGSTLPKKVLAALEKRPPEFIAITLYGYDEASYLVFTKSNSFQNVSKNIDLMKSKNLNVMLRTIPLPKTYLNLDKIIAFAKEKKLHLGHFLYVSNNNNNVTRLTPKELQDFDNRMNAAFPVKPQVASSKRCGAFKYGFFINHKGMMQGCPMMPVPTEKVTDNFKEVFERLSVQWKELLAKSPCRNCNLKDNCFSCLAHRYLEGNMFACSEYLEECAEEFSR